jgi:hypothetical protein
VKSFFKGHFVPAHYRKFFPHGPCRCPHAPSSASPDKSCLLSRKRNLLPTAFPTGEGVSCCFLPLSPASCQRRTAALCPRLRPAVNIHDGIAHVTTLLPSMESRQLPNAVGMRRCGTRDSAAGGMRFLLRNWSLQVRNAHALGYMFSRCCGRTRMPRCIPIRSSRKTRCQPHRRLSKLFPPHLHILSPPSHAVSPLKAP